MLFFSIHTFRLLGIAACFLVTGGQARLNANKDYYRKLDTLFRAEGNCLEVTLTGTAGGPGYFRGLAGSGTLVTYGSVESGCRDKAILQIDVGRGTGTHLSSVGIDPIRVDAVFFTHMHSDHTDGFSSFMIRKWIFAGLSGQGRMVDVVCMEDVEVVPVDPSKPPFNISCSEFVAAIGDPYIESGEVAQRKFEIPNINADGPAAFANVITFEEDTANIQEVWVSPKDPNVKVHAIASNHIGGHASFKVETPIGSVVVGGDASNDNQNPNNRETSTSAQVEMLAEMATVLVHTSIHPVLAMDGSTFPPPLYNRQSNAADIGKMANATDVKVVMLTHLTPAIGAPTVGAFTFPGGPLTEEDYISAVQDAGFSGLVVPGGDLSALRVLADGSIAMAPHSPSSSSSSSDE